MNSSEVYMIANQCREFSKNISSVVPELENAKSLLNDDQVGRLPDAITAKLDKLIDKLNESANNMAQASSIASKEADRLAEEERKAKERAIEKLNIEKRKNNKVPKINNNRFEMKQ